MRNTAIAVLCGVLNFDSAARAGFLAFGGVGSLPAMLTGLGCELLPQAGAGCKEKDGFSVSISAAGIIAQFGRTRTGLTQLVQSGHVGSLMMALLGIMHRQMHALYIAASLGGDGVSDIALVGIEALGFALMICVKGTVTSMKEGGRVLEDEVLLQAIKMLGQVVMEGLGVPSGAVLLPSQGQMRLLYNLSELASQEVCAEFMLAPATWTHLNRPGERGLLQALQALVGGEMAPPTKADAHNSRLDTRRKAKVLQMKDLQRPIGVRSTALLILLSLAQHRAHPSVEGAGGSDQGLKGTYCQQLIKAGVLDRLLEAAIKALPLAHKEQAAAGGEGRGDDWGDVGHFIEGAVATFMYLIAEGSVLTVLQMMDLIQLCREGPIGSRRYAAASLWCVSRLAVCVRQLDDDLGWLGLNQNSAGGMLAVLMPSLILWDKQYTHDIIGKNATVEFINWMLSTSMLALNNRMGRLNARSTHPTIKRVGSAASLREGLVSGSFNSPFTSPRGPEGGQERGRMGSMGDQSVRFEDPQVEEEEMRLLLTVCHQILSLEGLLEVELRQTKFLALCVVYRLVSGRSAHRA
jgi:hypothetical protein